MSQKMVNIPSTIQDPSYRYKMPKIITKIEGKGNGIKVNLVNLEDVAKALRVPIQYPLKYMGYELGSQTIYKKNGNEVQTIINGSFREEQIIEHLDKFICKYVVCSKCTYPEIKMTIKKGQIYGNCAACGVSNELDNKHRLAEFIKKNPPNDQTDFKNQKQVQTNQQQIENELFRQTDNFKTKLCIIFAILDQMIKELKFIYNQFSGSVETFDEDQDENFEKLLTYLKNKNFDIPAKSLATYIFFAAIFDTLTEASIQKNSYLIKKFFQFLQFKEEKSQAYTMINLQKFLLESDSVEPQKYIPSIMKHFYDEDIFTEDFLIDWSESLQKKQLTKHKLYNKENNKIFVSNSQQLIEWLRD